MFDYYIFWRSICGLLQYITYADPQPFTFETLHSIIMEVQGQIKNMYLVDIISPPISHGDLRLTVLMVWFWFPCISGSYSISVSQDLISVAALQGL